MKDKGEKNEKKNTKHKKICFYASMIAMAMILLLSTNVYAKGNPNDDPDNKYTVKYDKNKYTIHWTSRKRITACSEYGSMWKHLDKGDRLGSATIRGYYLEPKKSVSNKYYGIIGFQVSMDPEDVEYAGSDVNGMSQLVNIRINTKNPSSRVCTPTSELIEAQYTSTSNKLNIINLGAGLKYISKEKNGNRIIRVR